MVALVATTTMSDFEYLSCALLNIDIDGDRHGFYAKVIATEGILSYKVRFIEPKGNVPHATGCECNARKFSPCSPCKHMEIVDIYYQISYGIHLAPPIYDAPIGNVEMDALVAQLEEEFSLPEIELPELPVIEIVLLNNEPFSEEEFDPELPPASPAVVSVVPAGMVPSKYQQAIFDAVKRGEKSIVVTAVPGSGKTTTSKELIRYLPAESTVLALAFNSDAAKHLKAKIDEMLDGMRTDGLSTPQVDSRTIHSLGLETLKNAGFKTGTPKGTKYLNLCRQYLEAEGIHNNNTARHLSKLIDMVRLTLSDTDETSLFSLCSRFEIELPEDEEAWPVTVEAVPVILKRGVEMCKQQKVIDYIDMIYLPHALKLQPRKYDYVLVDEAQDLSPAQRELVLKARKANGAFIAVGDRNQSIYGFCGASLRSIDEIIEATNAKELPLSICYRCPKPVVELAATIYEGIEAARPQKDGEFVETIENAKVDSLIQAGDLILCRMTAPLVEKCLELLRAGKRANVRGKDLGTTFTSLLEKVQKFAKRGFDFANLETHVHNYEARQIEILTASGLDENESKIDSLKDKTETLLALYEAYLDRDGKDVDGFLGYIKSFFAEDKDAQIILSTGHRAKGLEYPRVFILQSDKPLKAKTPEAMTQELNVRYVMYTRAQKELWLVVERAKAPEVEARMMTAPLNGQQGFNVLLNHAC